MIMDGFYQDQVARTCDTYMERIDWYGGKPEEPIVNPWKILESLAKAISESTRKGYSTPAEAARIREAMTRLFVSNGEYLVDRRLVDHWFRTMPEEAEMPQGAWSPIITREDIEPERLGGLEMPKRADIEKEIDRAYGESLDPNDRTVMTCEERLARACKAVRNGYLKKIHAVAGRNILTYYSSFLQSNPTALPEYMVESDMNGFMNCIAGMDRTKGLDLILHTPGGNIEYTEGLVNYLHSFFGGDIRCIVPHIALSCGTMLACASRQIIMGRHSCLGPVDPQVGNVPANEALALFNKAAGKTRGAPEERELWKEMFRNVKPSHFMECRRAVRLSRTLTEKWLADYMFAESGREEALAKARKAADYLNSYEETMTHLRHFPYEKARELGLHVVRLEEERDGLQDLVLSLHHCYAILFERTKYQKIIENQRGAEYTFHLTNGFHGTDG